MSSNGNNFVPSPDGTFNGWSGNFVNTIAKDPAAFGVSAEQLTELQANQAKWETAYDNLFEIREQSKSATVAKDEFRNDFEEQIRKMAKRIQADSNVTDMQRQDAGLPIHSKTKTPTPVPSTVATAIIERQTHVNT